MNWKIIYNNFSNVEKRAVEFINKEVGRFLIRDEGVYSLYTLSIVKDTTVNTVDGNAFIIGVYDKSALIQRFVAPNELENKGSLLKVIDNPDDENASLVIITARDDKDLFYCAASFVDRYMVKNAVNVGGLMFAKRIFTQKLVPDTIKLVPHARTRGIFAWGHPINDYRRFFYDIARIGLNQLILWNDFKPLNADEIVECAHSYGIELLWGFAWGWINGCEKIETIDDAYLKKLKGNVIRAFEENYLGCGDGIYFQSFTERLDDNINGRSIADTVTDFVNDTAGELLKRYPDLKIQFGLHATSVKNRLEPISRVDKRVEIVWENGGVFPFDFGPVRIENKELFEKQFEETLEFTDKILALRGADAPTAIIFKGFMKLDWTRFVNQSGPHILGENHKDISLHDSKLRNDAWRCFAGDWIKNGHYAKRFTEHILEKTGYNINLCMAGLFDNSIYFPEAVCAELFYDPTEDYDDIMKRAIDKPCVTIE